MSALRVYPEIAYSAVRNRLGMPCKPAYCTFLITFRCNARCVMCDIPGRHGGPGSEMSIDEIRRAFSNIGRLHAVRISGGEPFVRQDLAEAVDAIQDISGPSVMHITTNGLLTERIVDLIKTVRRPENVHLKVSIDLYGEANSKVRGVPDAYERSVRTLEALAEIRKQRKFSFGVNQTIVNKDGAQDAEKLKALSDRLGAGFYQVIAYDTGIPLYSGRPGGKDGYEGVKSAFMAADRKALISDMKRLTSADGFNEGLSKRYYLKGIFSRLVNDEKSPSPPCVELSSHIRLLPDGNIPVCLFNDIAAGNVLKDDIKELWHSDRISKYRNIVKCCEGCWAGCEAIPNGIYTGDIIRGLL